MKVPLYTQVFLGCFYFYFYFFVVYNVLNPRLFGLSLEWCPNERMKN